MITSYILHKQDPTGKSEYFYGPFLSVREAWDWAENELNWGKSQANYQLRVIPLYSYEQSENICDE
jgi:hypothetical protein